MAPQQLAGVTSVYTLLTLGHHLVTAVGLGTKMIIGIKNPRTQPQLTLTYPQCVYF